MIGIDVSKWQAGRVKWNAESMGFAFAKATEGTSYVDPSFRDHVKGARDAGVPVGAYHFGRPKTNPIKSAEFFGETCVEAGITIPHLALDIEVADGADPSRVRDWIAAFVETLGGRVVIYSYPSFLKTLAIPKGDPLGNLDLWIAHYTRAPEPDLSGTPWLDWRIWQYEGDSGRHTDVMGPVDLNRFNGDFHDWIDPGYSRRKYESENSPAEWGPITADQAMKRVFP